MQIHEAKARFGWYLNQSSIVPAFGGAGWWLEVSRHGTDVQRITRQRGGDAVYKTIDAAWAAAYQIGFRETLIEHSGLIGI